MSKLRCHISISVDGFVAGPNQSEENPLGEGGERFTTESFRWPPGASPTRTLVGIARRGEPGQRDAGQDLLAPEGEHVSPLRSGPHRVSRPRHHRGVHTS